MFLMTRFRQVSLADKLIASSAPILGQVAQACERDKIQIILLDLHQLVFIDSVGLGLLVSLQNNLRRKGTKLYLSIPQKQAYTLFELANVSQIFEIFQDYDDFYATVAKNRLVLVNS
jgi:anti-anti-sigma factor